ncbi:hypothetical protein [Flavobacterium sp. ENC]|uniref:hypothetical protein n=1 Tax=Flavobacterium sp. ENC TaxID=2897330 RepID=UPI001E59450D|nr:hypothetical protein [Flavobacterium sp. ENC]MCD0468068.1 hypothetical protein [Flavobacterium sp. ENC]
MRKIVLLVFFICNVLYSQETFNNVIEGFASNEKKCSTLLKYRGRFILGKGFDGRYQNNDIVDIFTFNGMKTDFLLSHLGNYGKFKLYFLDYVGNLKLQLNTCETSDGGANFVLVDTESSSMFYLQSLSGISICKLDANSLTYKFNSKNFDRKIIKLDNKMMPTSSIQLTGIENEKFKIRLVNYIKKDNFFYQSVKFNETLLKNLFDIKYEEILDFLSIKLKKDTSEERCNEKYCDSYISRFFLGK